MASASASDGSPSTRWRRKYAHRGSAMNEIVFKTGWVKQALGWVVVFGSATCLIALICAIIKDWDTQTSADLWSAAFIGLFLGAFTIGGVAIQFTRWSIENDTIKFRTLFRTKTFPVTDLAGFGKITIVVGLFPLVHVDLFDGKLRSVVRLPVRIKDWKRAEAWFAPRLRYVVNDGSAALPKRRFADKAKG